MPMKLEPRWQPTWKGWSDSTQGEVFLGYAGEIDVYYEDRREDGSGPEPYIYVVCPPHRIRKGCGGYNFDGYKIECGGLVPESSQHDVHVELSEMCEVYNLAVKHGHIKLEDGDG